MMLGVNHEYATTQMMFPDLFGADGTFDRSRYTRRHSEVERAAVGISMTELRREGARWVPVVGAMNRKVDMLSTRVGISGPAAGHARMRTVADPQGRIARHFEKVDPKGHSQFVLGELKALKAAAKG